MNRNQKNFKSYRQACIQAIALANFYPDGRWCVYKKSAKHYIVCFDECRYRDGVDESDMLFHYNSHCNSGTQSYKECREYAEHAVCFLLN